MGEFRMPSLGADMTEGTLLEWLVGPGDLVHHGQIVAVIDTVKSAVDIEAFEDGEIESLLVEPGTTVAVGTPLARITRVEDTAVAAPAPAPTPPARGAVTPEPGRAATSPVVRHLAHDLGVDLDHVPGTGPGGALTRHDVEAAAASTPEPGPAPAPRPSAREGTRVPASPLARSRAAELGVDLIDVHGTGHGGAVVVADVEAAARGTSGRAAPTGRATQPAPRPRAAVSRTAELRTDARKDAMQAATGALMARSKREIPHYYLESTIDLAPALGSLSRHNDGRASAERVLPAALLLTATARSLRTVPELNGFYGEHGFEQRDEVDLGVAVSLRGGGLVVANLRGAEENSVDELMVRLKDIAVRARAGRLTGSEMSVPTVTVTNLGDQGADLVHGVIYPPQVALVGFGRIVERPWAVGGMLTVRPVVVATLAADHRVTDGHRGSRFLAALDAALQNPEELWT
ncbi:MAG TPA: dihydrolipoamide acetyltransferase family protein [Candidatus Nanopelagicales bacterium]